MPQYKHTLRASREVFSLTYHVIKKGTETKHIFLLELVIILHSTPKFSCSIFACWVLILCQLNIWGRREGTIVLFTLDNNNNTALTYGVVAQIQYFVAVLQYQLQVGLCFFTSDRKKPRQSILSCQRADTQCSSVTMIVLSVLRNLGFRNTIPEKYLMVSYLIWLHFGSQLYFVSQPLKWRNIFKVTR